MLLAAGLVLPAQVALVVGATLISLASRAPLYLQISIGVVLGAALGAIPGSDIAGLRPVGQIFIAMLKMLIAPMILLSISAGVARIGDPRRLGSIGLRTFGLYVGTSTVAVATGLVLVNLVRPGTGGALRETALFQTTVPAAGSVKATAGLGTFLADSLLAVLHNPFASLAEGRILPIVVFAVLLGLALVRLGPARARPAVEAIEAGYLAVMEIISWFVRLAPVGIFALIGHLVATVGFATLFESLLGFSAVVVGGTALHAGVTLPILARVLAGVKPGELFRGLREALLVALSTSSSAATLPVTTRCVEENLQVSPSISSFVLPLGATVNMDGTALYEAIAALFVANIYGVDLGLGAQLTVFLMAMLMSIGAPGIPSAGMVTMVVVLDAVGLPVEAVGLLISIDRFLDTFRTMVNVEGDAVVAVCVARTLPPAHGSSP
ncbi:MAG: dicarboxylate/amino acid:cation symporter [Myxococcota bacterium]